MSLVLITGSSGLIGSEAVRFFAAKGYDVVGIDNNMRRYFFGEDGSVAWVAERLKRDVANYRHHSIDVRDEAEVNKLVGSLGSAVELVIHAAAQPSHDWAAREPMTDFTVNANGTLVLLEAARAHCPDTTFIFTSTNKVYGDRPNQLPLEELETRWEIESAHPYHARGIDESMSIDDTMHSLFGAGKVAADVLVQEYGRYFGMKTGVFRGGCLTGPAQSGAELHGFLAYLVKCAVADRPYTIFGYKGKQVRDNIHSYDLITAFWHFAQDPKPGQVYNMGGSRHSNCSVLEAVQLIQDLSGKELNTTLSDQARAGDHIWWISDVKKFQDHYPDWSFKYDLKAIVREIVDATQERLGA
jgi:CDP-paratose 2-epimerase